MNKYVDNLSGYLREPETSSCYLDGNFFQAVFARYPNLLPTIHLNIKDRKQKLGRTLGGKEKEKVILFHMDKNTKHINPNLPGIARLSISYDGKKHCNLLIFDYQNKILYRLEPLGENKDHHYQEINNFLEEMAEGYELIPINGGIIPETNPMCDVSGYCVAYCILYAYSFLTQTPFEPDHIRRFATHIQKKYKLPPNTKPEIEYGDTTSTVLGATAGGLLGGALLGPVGLVGGAVGGGLLGNAL